jgi:hypothetical protein
MRPRVAALAALLLILAACAPGGGQPTERPGLETPAMETPGIGTPGTGTPVPRVTSHPSPAQTPSEPEAGCLEGDTYVEEGVVPLDGPAVGDAREVRDLRWAAHEGCERFVIDLAGEDGEPASLVGAMRAEVFRDLGVVRISLVHVDGVDPGATDAVFEGPIAAGAYAVVAPEGGWIHVDLHLQEAAEAHVFVMEDPARVVVDLRPSGGPVPEPPTIGDQVVVLQPDPGQTTYPLEVEGYARTFEGNVVVRLEQHGEDVYEDVTTATGWTDAWGRYSFTIEDGPAGRVQLHVGEHSARDGSWQGAAVELEMTR